MSAPMSSKSASDAEHTNPPVVRTLKPPPEIWELVHPVESKQFNPRLTLLRWLRSSTTGLLLMAIVAGLVLGVCIVVLRFRGVQKMTAVETIQPAQVGSASSGNVSNPAIDGSVPQPTDGSVSDNSRRATSPSGKRKVSVAVEARQLDFKSETTTDVGTHPATPPARSQAPATDKQSTGVIDSNQKSSSDSASAKPKSNTSLNPQVIAPLKSDSARKAKVIQWP
jgi:cytoskeletal protein RodZ